MAVREICVWKKLIFTLFLFAVDGLKEPDIPWTSAIQPPSVGHYIFFAMDLLPYGSPPLSPLTSSALPQVPPPSMVAAAQPLTSGSLLPLQGVGAVA
ncbi:hypothetical protein F2P79_001697 [Pimephales promelas]|nr:hypothetical protein F2P79_001680 [Pimephales promelas]KAG1969854.1 hypothetical protein F2P79_001697 [Pimephales promelas]